MKNIRPYKLFGDTAELTPLAQLIMTENITALDACLNVDWFIDTPFDITKHLCELPLTLALYENKLQVLDYLIEKGVDLNHHLSPAMVTAASNCSIDVLDKLINAGANINAVDQVKKNAYAAALYAGRIDLLSYLFNRGLEINGVVLRQAVYGRQIEAVKYFLSVGIDPNIRQPNMVFPNNPTALMVAAQNNDLNMVQLLLAHGADVTLTDNYGSRPYHHAIAHNNQPMIDCIKTLEPAELHNEESKINLLKSYGLPDAFIEFIKHTENRLKIKHENITFLQFSSIINIKEAVWNGEPYFDLLADVDNYDALGFLVWFKNKKTLANIDYEHEEVHVFGDWETFINAPEIYIERLF